MLQYSTILLGAAALLGRPAAGQGVQPTLMTDSLHGWTLNAADSDEFTSFDGAKWSHNLGDWIGTPPAIFVPGNSYVDPASEALMLRTKKDPDAALGSDAADCDCGFGGMSSGMVVSTKQFKHGFFEVEAKFAKASLLSSFWLQGTSGEINVFEAVPASLASDGTQKMRTNYHCFELGGDPEDVESASQDMSGLPDNFDATKYHTYGLDWDSTGVKIFVDGKQVRAMSAACLSEQMNVVLSVETTAAEGVPADAALDKTTAFRYFRHWTRGPKPTPAPTSFLTAEPTTRPTDRPTAFPTVKPTKPPTDKPTSFPTAKPTKQPTEKPTAVGTSEPEPETETSELTCSELRYKFRYGNEDVCGASKIGGKCSINQDFNAAAGICRAAGSRLCSVAELEQQATRGTGCGYDRQLIWTKDMCSTTSGAEGRMVARGANGSRKACKPLAESKNLAVRCCGDTVVNRPPPPPASQKTCSALGWPYRWGNRPVCGESDLPVGAGGSKVCLSNRDHQFAKDTCAAAGGRLCTEAELANDATRGTGCGHDKRMIWTSDTCTTEDGSPGFRARAGRDASWLPQPQCLAASSTEPAVRCCSDEFVTRGSTGELRERGTVGSVYQTMQVQGVSASDAPYGAPEDMISEAQAEAMRAEAVAAMYPDDYADEESGAGSASSGAATASAVTVLAVAAVLVVGAALYKKRKGATEAAPDSGEAAIRRPSTASFTEADEALRSVPPNTAVAIPADEACPNEIFEDNGFVYNPRDGLRMVSVKRSNPGYRQSVYNPDDAVLGAASIDATTTM